MPRIPTRDSLRQGVPQSTGGIVRAPRDFVGGALEQAGNQIYAKAEEERKQQGSLELVKARSEFSTALLQESSSYTIDQRPEYGTWDETFKKRAPHLQKKAIANISDPDLQERFRIETQDDIARVGIGINGNARKISVEARKTAAETGLDQMVNNASQLPDEEAKRVFSDIKATLQDMVDTGFFTKEEAAQRSINYARKYAAVRAKQAVDNDPVQARSILSGEKASASTLIKQFEGFRNTPYWDVNANRVGYGSDTITTASGQVVKVKPGMTVSRADAERDLERRIGEFQSVIHGQVGKPVFDKLTPNAQAALTSMAYNYGSLPNSVAKAVKSGNIEAIASAIEARATDNGGVNEKRRLEEAAIVRGDTGNLYASMGERPLWAGSLSAEQRSEFLSQAQNSVQRLDDARTFQDKVKQEELKVAVESDILSIYNTGQPTELNEADVRRELGPLAADRWIEQREDAAQVYTATERMPTLPDNQLNEIVESARPKRGSENFSRQKAVHDEIAKQAEAVRQERRDNPARAAMRIPSVTRALSEAQNPRTTSPQKVQSFVREMISTQSTFGVPRSAIAPIPDEWAMEIGKVLLKFPTEQNNTNRDQIAQALSATYKSMEEQYGDMTDEVISYSMMRTKAVSNEMSKTLNSYLKGLAGGRPITKAERAEAARQRDQDQAENTSSSWWNPTSWISGEVPDSTDRMPSRDEMVSIMTMEDDAAKAEALQALTDEYGETAVSAAKAMYQ